MNFRKHEWHRFVFDDPVATGAEKRNHCNTSIVCIARFANQLLNKVERLKRADTAQEHKDENYDSKKEGGI